MNAEDAIEFSRSKLARDIARLLNGQSRTERRAILTMANNILVAERFMMLLSWKGSYCNLAL